MRKIFFLPALLLIFAASCTPAATFQDYILSYKLTETTNVLRYRVNVSVAKDCVPRVEYREKGSEKWLLSADMTLLFLLPDTEYEYRVVANGLPGEVETFRTGSLPEEVPTFTVEYDNGGPSDGFLMQTKESAPGYVTFCDMKGRVVWYERFDEGIRCAHYDPGQGKIAVLTGFNVLPSSTGVWRTRYATDFYVIDLEGSVESHFKAGENTSPYPHHEIKLMPDGNILTVEAVPMTIDLSMYNGYDKMEIWGDGYVILDREGRRLSDWNIFTELKVAENADWLFPVERQYDLVHANSVSWDTDGNFYMTFHYISEIWKINAANGKVAYRLGEHGNLSLDVPYAEGGFHAVVPLYPDTFIVNNNAQGAGAVTHAQVYEVDVKARKAVRILNVANKPEYSVYTGGNAELILDGKMVHFDSTSPKTSVFTDLEGNTLKVIKRKDNSYRAFYFPYLP